MSGQLHASSTDAVLTLTIDAESKANAMTHAMTRDLASHLERAENDDDIAVVVITGTGRHAFCSGHDITELVADPTSAYDPKINAIFQTPRHLSKPTIAAVNGAAFAGGLNLVLACDLRIASTGATFAATGARLALLPLAGQLSVLPSLAGPGIALDMLLRGRPISARRAYEIGLVSEIVEPDDLEHVAAEAAEFIASTPSALNNAIKRAVWSTVEVAGQRAREVETGEAARFGEAPEATRRLGSFLNRK